MLLGSGTKKRRDFKELFTKKQSTSRVFIDNLKQRAGYLP